MKKIILLGIIMLFSVSLFAGPSKGSFGAIFKNKKGNANVKVIKADDINMIFFTVDINPRHAKKYDLITVYIKRPKVLDGWLTFNPKILNTKGKSKKIKGNRVMYYRVVNYQKNKDGKGAFYNSKYQQYLNGNLILSKKGNNYSKRKTVNSYKLSGYVVGQKILRYRIGNSGKKVPVYSREQYIINPVKLTVKTSSRIKPMKKSYVVKDTADFKLMPTN